MDTPPESIFEQFVASLGVAFLPGELVGSSLHSPAPDSPIAHYSDILRYVAASPVGVAPPFKYCAGLVYSNIPTGYCSYVADHFCVGVTTAMYNCCLEASLRTFQSDQTFVDIGRLSKPPTNGGGNALEPVPWGFKWREELRKREAAPHRVGTAFDPWSVPEFANALAVACPVRRACAEYVAQMMITFLWSHEVAHAISGHLPYLQHHSNVRTISENDWFDPTQEEKYLYTATRLWMEHDADTSAINTLLASNMSGVVIHKTGVAEIDGNQDLRLRLDVEAIVLTFLIILFQYDWGSDGSGSHPDPLRRMFVGVMSAITLIRATHSDAARIATAILQEIRALVLANRGLHQPLTMFFAPLTVDLATKEYNDLVAQVAPQIPKIRAFSYFDANGRLEVPY